MPPNNNKQQQSSSFKLRRNHQIKAFEVRLIDSDGSNIGVVSLSEALKKAREQSLDLIEINPKSTPVIAKIGDFGKMQYDLKKQAQATKKNHQVQEQKEIAFRPHIADNDLLIKTNQARKFLSEGMRVKITVKFFGREITHVDVGEERLKFVLEKLQDLIVESPKVSLEGKFMSTLVSPKPQSQKQNNSSHIQDSTCQPKTS